MTPPPPATKHGPIDRVGLAWICVATNDGNPLHLDREFAARAGHRDVVVPAHFVIGWIGEYLAAWCGGPANLLGMSIRFTAPVWPGDEVRICGELDAGGAAKVRATVGERVVGIATAALKAS